LPGHSFLAAVAVIRAVTRWRSAKPNAPVAGPNATSDDDAFSIKRI
jgi:hypothetical protein